MSEKYKELVEAAREAATRAYAPYSKKPQGAAVLTAGGDIVCGVTVESASLGASLGAEINALTQAVALGHRRFKAIAIEPYSHPSGVARQIIAEFGIDCDLVKGTPTGVEVYPMRTLLPHHFGPDNLEAERLKRDATRGSIA